MKVPHRYDVQVSDTTMMPGAASLHGQKDLQNKIYKKPQSPARDGLKMVLAQDYSLFPFQNFPLIPYLRSPVAKKGAGIN